MSPQKPIDIFFEVFKDIRFPYLSVDVDMLRKSIDNLNNDNPRSNFSVLTNVQKNRKDKYISSIRGLFAHINIPDYKIIYFSKIPTIRLKKYSERLLRASFPKGNFAVTEENGKLIWTESSLWPVAYATQLKQFVNLIFFHKLLMEEEIKKTSKMLMDNGWALENVKKLSEFPRQLPTHIHYAMASLGAWVGGAINVQYFAYYATIRQIHHTSLNLQYAIRIGYSSSDAKKLSESGIILMPASLILPLLEAQEENTVFGSLPFDETNAANSPHNLFFTTKNFNNDHRALSGFMMDKYYRTPFMARQPAAYAMYGSKDILRDHYQDFYSGVNIDSLIRCKHYCIPIIEVNNVIDMQKHVKNIPIHHKDGIFFRGQRKLHLLYRDEIVKSMLFDGSCSIEPSLITSASRDMEYDYDDVHFILKHFLEQKILLQDDLTNSEISKIWREQSKAADCKLDTALLALAQHYGLPSHGLDITTSNDVAVWFATNTFLHDNVSGVSSYAPMSISDWPKNKEDWPVIIACQTVTHSIQSSLHDCEKLAEYGFEASRPIAQKARFFQGGHSDHQNRLAESVICIFRLAPGEYKTESTFESLFPEPNKDPAYKVMLELAKSPDFGARLGKYINKFH